MSKSQKLSKTSSKTKNIWNNFVKKNFLKQTVKVDLNNNICSHHLKKNNLKSKTSTHFYINIKITTKQSNDKIKKNKGNLKKRKQIFLTSKNPIKQAKKSMKNTNILTVIIILYYL